MRRRENGGDPPDRRNVCPLDADCNRLRAGAWNAGSGLAGPPQPPRWARPAKWVRGKRPRPPRTRGGLQPGLARVRTAAWSTRPLGGAPKQPPPLGPAEPQQLGMQHLPPKERGLRIRCPQAGDPEGGQRQPGPGLGAARGALGQRGTRAPRGRQQERRAWRTGALDRAAGNVLRGSSKPLRTTSSDRDPKAVPSPGDRAASRAYGCPVGVRPTVVTTHPAGPATSSPGTAGQTPGPVLRDCGFVKSPPPWSSCAGTRRWICQIPWNVCPGHCHSIFLAGLWSLRVLPGQRQWGEARPGRPVSAPGAEEGSSFLLSVFKDSIYLLLRERERERGGERAEPGAQRGARPQDPGTCDLSRRQPPHNGAPGRSSPSEGFRKPSVSRVCGRSRFTVTPRAPGLVTATTRLLGKTRVLGVVCPSALPPGAGHPEISNVSHTGRLYTETLETVGRGRAVARP
ncbi:uncharacterized protein LOC121494575 [Vulpes lagopus]|uniref:uncharacterized protein LOC121494575 n=1 Tax=Vulpes lagopus TaxID=494514 RepID=UPI001BC97F4E|nr:uncharacterized protein LOC121494575 [Vulpes lagopus]